MALLGVSAPAGAQVSTQSASPQSAAPTPTPTPAPVALADVVAAGESVSAKLREIETNLNAGQSDGTVGQELPLLTQEISDLLDETTRSIKPGVSLEILHDLGERWQKLSLQLVQWTRDLTNRASLIEKEIALLPEWQSTWTQTLEAGRTSSAPPEITRRIESILTGIDETTAVLRKRRASILTLQSRVAEQTQRVLDAQRSIKTAQDAAVDQLWMRDSPPIWSAEVRAAATHDLVEESQISFGTQFAQLRAYMAREWTKLIYLALVFFAFAFVLFKIKQQAARWTDEDPALRRANRILQLPLATAGVLTFLVSRSLFPQAPRLFWAALAALALVPIVILLRRLIDRHLFPILNALVVFYIVAQIRNLASSLPVLSRVMLLLEMVGGAIFLAWFVRATRSPERGTTSRKATRAAARVGFVLFIAVFVVNALGYVGLANYLGIGALAAAYLAILFYAAAGIVEGLSFFALQVPPLSSLGVVRNHQPLLRRRIARLIYFAAFVIWALLTLGALSLRTPVINGLSNFINAEVSIRSLHFSLGGFLAFALTIWFALLLSRFVRFLLEEDIYDRFHVARGSSYAISTVLHYIILLIGFYAALAAVGADMTRFAILAGAFGVGIGFGLQNIFNNFISGLILLFERPVQVGDVIEVGGATGTVQRIGIRASIVRLANSSELIVPNGQLISEKVGNWTLSNRQRRMEVHIGVAYDSDPKGVIELLAQVAAAHPLVASKPTPEAFMLEFGADSLRFELLFWTDDFDHWPRIQSDVAVAVKAALLAAKIEIPFPQRALHLQSIGSGVADAFGKDSTAPSPTPSQPQ